MSELAPADPVQLGDDGVPELYRSGRAKQVQARNRRWAAYAVGLAVLVPVVAFADWKTIRESYFDWQYAKELFPEIITIGARNTLIYTFFAFVGGVMLGVSMAVLRMSSIKPYRWFATAYVEIFRGFPALLTIILVGYVTPIAIHHQFPQVLGIESSGALALAIVAGAYLAETMRAGIEAVPKGHIEAARSLGMTNSQTLRIIVLPQALRIMVPPLTNELVLLLKDTSLLAVLGATPESRELLKYANDSVGMTFNGTPLIVAGVIYLLITIPLTRLVAQLEKKNRAIR